MRWLGTWERGARGVRWTAMATLALVLTGCPDGDGDGYFDDGSDTTEGEVEPMVDYSVCQRAMRDSTCDQALCGTSPEAQDYLQIMLEEVGSAGYSTKFTPTVAEYFALTNELRIDYQLQVSWFRVANTFSVEVPQTEDLLRKQMDAHIALWDIPLSVATPEQMTEAVESCHALLTYDHCTDNQLDFTVRSSYDWENPDCTYKTTYAVVDADNHATLECVVEQELPCG